MQRRALFLSLFLVLGGLACFGSDPERYRLSGSPEWRTAGEDSVFDDVQPRYRGFFHVILDPNQGHQPDIRALRNDLERQPADLHSYDALNAIAIAYFELNARAQSDRGGETYMADSFRAAKMLALPWRAYGEVAEPEMRSAILDFFEDASSPNKAYAAETSPRLKRIVASLEKKELDEARLGRIRALVAQLTAREVEASTSAPE